MTEEQQAQNYEIVRAENGWVLLVYVEDEVQTRVYFDMVGVLEHIWRREGGDTEIFQITLT